MARGRAGTVTLPGPFRQLAHIPHDQRRAVEPHVIMADHSFSIMSTRFDAHGRLAGSPDRAEDVGGCVVEYRRLTRADASTSRHGRYTRLNLRTVASH